MSTSVKLATLVKASLVASVLALFAVPAMAAATEAPAPVATKQKRECFHTNQISGWNWVDDKTVRLSVGPRRSYDLTLFSEPISLRFSETIGIEASPSPFICAGNGLGVNVYVNDFGRRSFPVTKIVRSPTRAEEKARKALEKSEPTPASHSL